MEPVEIDFMYGGNTETEGAKIEKSLDDISAAHIRVKSDILRHDEALLNLRKDLVGLGTDYKNATSKDQKSEILSEIEITKKNILDEKDAVKQLKAELSGLSKTKIAPVDSVDASNVGKAAVGYNSLNYSVQQVVRELPAASVSMSTFFLGISNNLPILADNIKRARYENEALKASGASTTPVWKQLLSSMVSWQSIMMVGITLLTMYGKDFISYIEKLVTGKNEIDKTAESQKALNKVFSDFSGSASKKIQDITKIGIEIKKYGDNSANAKQIINDFNKTFNTHLKTIEQVKNAYPAMSKAAIDAAIKIQAANSLIEKSAQATLKKQEADTALSGYKKSTVKPYEAALDNVLGIMQKYGASSEQLNKITGDLIAGVKPMGNLFDYIDSDKLKLGSKEFEGVYSDFWRNMDKITNDKSGAFFVKYIAQQRKSGKLINLGNKEIEKLLTGVNLNDFSSKNTETKDKPIKEAYDAEKELQKMLLDIESQTSKLLIDQQTDSLKKRLDAIDLEKQLEVQKIEEKEIAIVTAYNKNHKGEKGFKPLSTDSANISASVATIDPSKAKEIADASLALDNAYAAKRQEATKKWGEELTTLAMSFANERVKIEAEYDKKIKDLKDKGLTDAVANATAERDKKISEVTAGLIQETDLYKLATNDKLQASKETTEKLIADIKARILAEQAAGKLSSETAKKMLADINSAQKTVAGDKIKNNPFSQLGASITGNTKAGAALKAGKLDTKTSKEDLAKLEDEAAKATASMAGAAGAALDGVQGILTSVVGGLDQLGLLNEQEKKDAQDVIGMVSGAATLAKGIATGNPIDIITGSVGLLTSAFSLFDRKSKDIAKKQKAIEANLNDLTAAYKRLQKAVEDALGTDVYKDQRESIQNLQAQIRANEAWLAQEYRKKKKKQNQDAIADRKAEIEALKNEISDTADAIVEGLAQTNAKDLASQLGDALVTAFSNGEDAAVAMGNVVNDVIKNAVSHALKLQFLEKPMQKAVEQLAADMESNGELTSTEQSSFEKKIQDAGKLYYEQLGKYSNLFTGDTTAQTGIKGDTAKMTEETGTALTGQIIAMRLNIVAILATNKNAVDVMSRMLAIQEDIRTNTSFCRRLDRIDETLYYLKLNGIKVV